MGFAARLNKLNDLILPVFLIFIASEMVFLVLSNYTQLGKMFFSLTCNFACNTGFFFPGMLFILTVAGTYFWLKKRYVWVWGTSVLPFFFFSFQYLKEGAF